MTNLPGGIGIAEIKLAIAPRDRQAPRGAYVPGLQQLIGIDIDGDGDVFG